MERTKPTVGIFGLTGCAGDQLAILNCEDELLRLVELIDIREFLMASSEGDPFATLDVALVEGAVLSRRDEETLLRVRRRARTLVAIGTCAVWGGVAAMGDGMVWQEGVRDVYGPAGDRFDALAPRALHEVVDVDFSISGCPIEQDQFLAAMADILNGNPPTGIGYPVCTECRMRECNCLLSEQGLPCLGALTQAGCHARCPSVGIPCIGCRGPADDANVAAGMELLIAKGLTPDDVARRLRTFAPLPTTTAEVV
jgi:coenzyme F420-reducing hydrogenase gamma subunit